MEYKQRNPSVTTIEQVMEYLTGISINDLLHPKQNPYIHRLLELAEFVKQAIANKMKIYIYGDYDVDGVCGASILYRLLTKGFKYDDVHVELPGRATTGYGFQPEAAKELIAKGCEVLITVDNGISANEAIQMMKDAKVFVAVLDHHPSVSGVLPNADVIVDPNADGNMSEYCEYCGAGLALRLAETLGYGSLTGLKELAAIATIADVMKLVGDNRRIVKEGLSVLNESRADTLPGLQTLLDKTGIVYVDVDDVGFTIGPIINAADRMAVGAKLPLQLLIQDAGNEELVDRLIRINNDRKMQTQKDMIRVQQKIESDCLFGDCPLFVTFTEEDGPMDSLNGILAGRLTEEYHVPAFVASLNPKDGLLHGSGRSIPEINIKAALDAAADCFVRYGGHPAAAGITLKPEDAYRAAERLKDIMSGYEITEAECMYYDLEIDASQIPDIKKKLDEFKPFGTGCPAPIFKVKNFRLIPYQGQFYKAMSSDTVKLLGEYANAIGFSMLSKYQDDGEPKLLNLYGTLKENIYKGYKGIIEEIQVEFRGFEQQYEKKESSLRAALLSGLMSV